MIRGVREPRFDCVYIFFICFSSYMLPRCRHIQAAYSNISSKPAAINSLQQTHVFFLTTILVRKNGFRISPSWRRIHRDILREGQTYQVTVVGASLLGRAYTRRQNQWRCRRRYWLYWYLIYLYGQAIHGADTTKLSGRPPTCRRDAGDPLVKYAGTVRRAGAHSSSMWCTLFCCVSGEDRCLFFCSSL